MNVGDRVVILPPFGDEATVREIVGVRYVAANGQFTDAPSDFLQYVLDDGYEYAEKNVRRA